MTKKVPVRYTLSVRLNEKDMETLASRAEAMGLSASTLARVLIHSALSGEQSPFDATATPTPETTSSALQTSQGETPSSPLTSREAEILSMIAEGHTNRRVAHALDLSEETIKKDLASVIRKLSADDRTHAVVLAIRQGHIRPG